MADISQSVLRRLKDIYANPELATEQLRDTLRNFNKGQVAEINPQGAGMRQLSSAERTKQITQGALENAGAGPVAGGLGVIKTKGGNWLKGEGLSYLDNLMYNINPQAANTPERRRMLAVDNWVSGPLTKYIKNQLGTAQDPLLRLADEGISTLPKEQLLALESWQPRTAVRNRKASGLEQPDLGGYAQGWSDIADSVIIPEEVGGIRTGYGRDWRIRDRENNTPYFDEYIVPREGEWLKKASDEDTVYGLNEESMQDLGFDKLVQSLEGLMQEGKISAEQLQQMGMEKAVRRVAEEQAAKRAALEQAGITNMREMPLHKEYPEGFSWRKLEQQGVDPDELRKYDSDFSSRVQQLRYNGLTADAAKAEALKTMGPGPAGKLRGWLNKEGEAMGHCVGGYCDDVLSGQTEVYSLKDAKGAPHVTVQVTPGPDGLEIQQIKGKGNAKPADKYLPFVQDFVKSGKWSDVQDFENTGLIDLRGKPKPQGLGDFVTKEEWDALVRQVDIAPPEFKSGGLMTDEMAYPGVF